MDGTPAGPRESQSVVVLYEKRDRIAHVTINRPESRNAVSPEVHRAMIAVWADFAADEEVDVAILTGAGDETFCAGADLKTYIPPIIEDSTPADLREIVELGLNGFTRGMHRIEKPIVGAVSGWALAGGFETALACDIRIASERAMFGSFEARRGFHHGDGGPVRLVNAGGVGVAMHMLLTAEPIDARQALEWNLVSKVVPHGSLMEEAETVARQILRNSQHAVRSAKQTILDVVGQPLDSQLGTEAWNAYTCAGPEETSAMLERFYAKTDARHGRDREGPRDAGRGARAADAAAALGAHGRASRDRRHRGLPVRRGVGPGDRPGDRRGRRSRPQHLHPGLRATRLALVPSPPVGVAGTGDVELAPDVLGQPLAQLAEAVIEFPPPDRLRDLRGARPRPEQLGEELVVRDCRPLPHSQLARDDRAGVGSDE